MLQRQVSICCLARNGSFCSDLDGNLTEDCSKNRTKKRNNMEEDFEGRWKRQKRGCQDSHIPYRHLFKQTFPSLALRKRWTESTVNWMVSGGSTKGHKTSWKRLKLRAVADVFDMFQHICREWNQEADRLTHVAKEKRGHMELHCDGTGSTD